jgi:hypothetical protein
VPCFKSPESRVEAFFRSAIQTYDKDRFDTATACAAGMGPERLLQT